jgi:phosphoribosylaminoimidazole (AIR) synthetase
MKIKITYKDAGVDYGALKKFKRLARGKAKGTANNLELYGTNTEEVLWSRGKSAYIIDRPDCYVVHTGEGLGIKILVPDAVDASYDWNQNTFFTSISSKVQLFA